MPKVSIIIPVYNAEKFISKCLDSVLNQSLREIEVFCIDDGSTDKSWEILQRYAKKDERLTAIQQVNSGAAIARNKGLKRATGEYIGFVDADDSIDENYFEELYRTAIDSNADISRAFVKVKFDNENLVSQIRMDVDSYERFYNDEGKEAVESDKLKLRAVIWLSIYRTSFLRENNITFVAKLRTGQDSVFNLYASYYANKIVHTQNRVYYYRLVRDDSLMTQFNYSSSGLLSRALVLQEVVSFINSKHDYNKDAYIEKVTGALNFILDRAANVKGDKTFTDISRIMTATWSKIKYKDGIKEFMFENRKEYLQSIDDTPNDDNLLLYYAQNDLREENLRLKQSLEEVGRTLDDLYHSKSWKVTKPMRAVKKIISVIKRSLRIVNREEDYV